MFTDVRGDMELKTRRRAAEGEPTIGKSLASESPRPSKAVEILHWKLFVGRAVRR